MIRGGSYILVPKLANPYDIASNLRSILIPIHTFRYNPTTPLRILDRQTPAGFYSTGWGLLPFSYSREPLEEIEVSQVNFMAERLPSAEIVFGAGIKPWPGILSIGNTSPVAILAKPETLISFPFPVSFAVQLQLLCGVSSDSYPAGSTDSYQFDVRQMGVEGNVLAESHITLQPGIREQDRAWQPVEMALRKVEKGILEFRYTKTGKERAGVGAFAQPVLRPIF
jgi:hypothetical protein